MSGFRIERVDLRVTDVDRAAEFYGFVSGEPSVPGTLVGLSSEGVTGGGNAPRGATGLFHTALRFSERGGLAAALRRLIDSGRRLTGASDHGVSEALYLDDPDGNGVELYWDRSRDQWPAPTQPGDRVGMFSIALDLDDLLATPDAESVVDIGHVHLKVSDVQRSEAFWAGEMALDVMARYGSEASFLAADGYHHHVGVNSWLSAGAAPGPRALPGLERVVLRDPSAGEDRGVTDPDGIEIVVQAG